jgi:hypothetical protein
MILHVASIAAFFVDQLAFEPVVVQCAPTESESWVKWLLPTIVQTTISLVSIVVGVGIAVWSFRRNRQSEHEQWVRNQKVGHEQWTRDQKKAEWKELLKSVAEFGNIVPVVIAGRADYEEIAKRLVFAIQKLEERYANSPFLFEFASSKANNDRISDFQEQATKVADRILSPEHKIKMKSTDTKKRLDVVTERLNLCMTFRAQYIEFIHWLQAETRKDLGFSGIKPSAPPVPDLHESAS